MSQYRDRTAYVCHRCRTTLWNAGAMRQHRLQCAGHAPRKEATK